MNATIAPAPAGMTVTIDGEPRPVVALVLTGLDRAVLPVFVSASGALRVATHDDAVAVTA